ncbi:hypothetical protein ACW0KB_02485 [Virgibacillus salarius]
MEQKLTHAVIVNNSTNGPKELFWVEGATHVALYDIPEYVNQAVPKLTAFFGKIL